MGFSRQEYWGGLPFPSPGDLPNPRVEPACLMSSLYWQVGSLPLAPPGKPPSMLYHIKADNQLCHLYLGHWKKKKKLSRIKPFRDLPPGQANQTKGINISWRQMDESKYNLKNHVLVWWKHTKTDSIVEGRWEYSCLNEWVVGLPLWSSGSDSMFPVQGAWVQSLVRKLDLTTTTKSPCCNKDGRSHVPQLRPGAAK